MCKESVLKQLNAECVNIVEPDGTLRLSLYNSLNMAPIMMDGANLLPGHREGQGISGIMFYNSEGDECGGMGMSSRREADGSYYSSMSMTFDQYKQDQVVQVSVSEKNGQRSYGYTIYDRPNKHISENLKVRKTLENPNVSQSEKERVAQQYALENAVRMRLGKNTDGSVSVRINDSKGNPKLDVTMGADGVPCIVMYDKNGTPHRKFPAETEGRA